MNEIEQEALLMIRNSKDPEAALIIAIEIIKDYVTLTQPLSLKEQEVENLAG